MEIAQIGKHSREAGSQLLFNIRKRVPILPAMGWAAYDRLNSPWLRSQHGIPGDNWCLHEADAGAKERSCSVLLKAFPSLGLSVPICAAVGAGLGED